MTLADACAHCPSVHLLTIGNDTGTTNRVLLITARFWPP